MAYRVELRDTARAEAEAGFLWLARLNPEYAGRWYAGLLDEIASLADMPQRCPVAEESDAFDVTIRRKLYGRGRNVWKILFHIVEEDQTVWVLHIRHTAQRLLTDPEEDDV